MRDLDELFKALAKSRFRAGIKINTADRAYFQFQLQLRQQLIIRDLGYWSHFVADASQPMHVSVHFNGWGSYPNPNGYTTAPIHAPFEGAFVRSYVDFSVVASHMRPYTDRGVNTIEQRTPLYLAETLAQVIPTYQAAKDSGNDNYATPQPEEVAIVVQQRMLGHQPALVLIRLFHLMRRHQVRFQQ